MRTVLLVLCIALGLVGAGHMLGSADAREQLRTERAEYARQFKEADTLRIAADLRAENLERSWTTYFTDLDTTYQEKRRHEKALDDRTIADLRNDVVRLRVRTATLASGGQVRGTAAGAGERDGPPEQTLAGPVAARLAGRYADYNGLVDQLTVCQDTLLAERRTP